MIIIMTAQPIAIGVSGIDQSLKFFLGEVVRRRRFNLDPLQQDRGILIEPIHPYAKPEEGNQSFMFAASGGRPIVPLGAELCERRHPQLIEKDEALTFSPGLQLFSEEEFALSLTVVAEMARFLVIAKTLDGILDPDSFPNAWFVGIGDIFHRAHLNFRLFPTACFRRRAQEAPVRQCSLNPFGTTTAPMIDIGVRAWCVVTTVNREHFSRPLSDRLYDSRKWSVSD
jgi:hypothetical protein